MPRASPPSDGRSWMPGPAESLSSSPPFSRHGRRSKARHQMCDLARWVTDLLRSVSMHFREMPLRHAVGERATRRTSTKNNGASPRASDRKSAPKAAHSAAPPATDSAIWLMSCTVSVRRNENPACEAAANGPFRPTRARLWRWACGRTAAPSSRAAGRRPCSPSVCRP